MTNDETPVSVLASERGIKSCADFTNFFASLMSDLVNNRIDPETAKAACQCGDQILRMAKFSAELQQLAPEVDPISPTKQKNACLLKH